MIVRLASGIAPLLLRATCPLRDTLREICSVLCYESIAAAPIGFACSAYSVECQLGICLPVAAVHIVLMALHRTVYN